jgi:hypothetical protein
MTHKERMAPVRTAKLTFARGLMDNIKINLTKKIKDKSTHIASLNVAKFICCSRNMLGQVGKESLKLAKS